LELVRLAQTAAEVDRRVKAELASILFLADREVRAARAFELLGRDVGGPLDALGAGVGAGDGARPAVVDPQGNEDLDAAVTDDLARFVPVVEREVGGRKVLTARARDIHVFVGSSRWFSNWFDDQKGRCQLVEGRDYADEVSNEVVGNPTGGRPRREYVVTLDAAKEIGMVDRGPRGKELRRYFIDCERRLLDREQAVPGKAIV
jgi:phage anti-repressor protein